eukprot:960109-Pelagomonas_calceolata.AAC.2
MHMNHTLQYTFHQTFGILTCSCGCHAHCTKHPICWPLIHSHQEGDDACFTLWLYPGAQSFEVSGCGRLRGTNAGPPPPAPNYGSHDDEYDYGDERAGGVWVEAGGKG